MEYRANHKEKFQNEQEGKLIFFDLSRTIFDTFRAGNNVLLDYWNTAIKDEFRSFALGNDLNDLRTRLDPSDLAADKYSDHGTKRLFCHKIYKSLNGWREFQRVKSSANYDRFGGATSDDNEKATRHANRLVSVIEELLDSRLQDFLQRSDKTEAEKDKILKDFEFFKRDKLGIDCIEDHKKRTYANAKDVMEKVYKPELLSLEYYHQPVIETIKKLKQQGHKIGIITRNKPRSSLDPQSVFHPTTLLLDAEVGIDHQLIFTRENGDKKIYEEVEGSGKKGLPSLLKAIRERCDSHPDITANMLENAVMVGDMYHDGNIAAEMGWDWIRAEYGQDRNFLTSDKVQNRNKAAEKEIAEKGKNALVAKSYEALEAKLQTLCLLPPPAKGQSFRA
jgi:phosphoglycolate phosphatase-like HAD superfamily hydrolase